MWKKAISIIFLLFLVGCAAVDSDVSKTHTAGIEISGVNEYKAVRLTPQIYNSSNYDLSDLLIKDSSGEDVPYFLNTGSSSAHITREVYQMSLINSYIKDDKFYFDYMLAVERDGDMLSTSIEFTTKDTGFAKEVDVYGSFDNMHWEFVQSDKIYSIDDKSKLEIKLARPQKYTHYRLELANNLEQIAFSAVCLVYHVEMYEESFFIESLEPAFTVESADRKTDIIIEGLHNLRLCDVTIHTESMFMRNAGRPQGGSKELYNLTLNGTSYSDTTMPLGWYIPRGETFIITIDDGDDKPIAVSSVTVRYYADDVVFKGESGGVYTLEFSGNAEKRAPVYDIERYKNDILKGEIDSAAIGEINYAIDEAPPERDFKLVFNIVIVAVTLLLGVVILLKLKKK